jgi:undecaprenyl-diphosphatase
LRIHPKYPIAVAAMFAVLLLMTIWFILTGRADSFDFPTRDAILALNSPNEVHVWKEVTFLGSTLVITGLTILCVLIFIVRNEWQAARHIVVVMVGASVIDNALKWVIRRPRPPEIFPHTMPSSYSFPSGHALFGLAFYISLAMIIAPHFDKITRVVVLGLAISVVFLIGASRVFLGVHYPLDVIGGYAAAALWLTLVEWHKRMHNSA